jgi:hypothetical protein
MTPIRSVLVKETPVLHGGDVIRWLDGTSAADLDPVNMAPLDRPLAVAFSTRPLDLEWIHKRGRTALWRKPTADVLGGEASEAQRARPVLPLFRVAGSASDPSGAWHPRAFDLTLGDGAGRALVLYPTPQATRLGSGGGLFGSLRFDGGEAPTLAGRPVAWALIEVAVTLSPADLRRFRAQADARGEFRLSLWRLPPLPEGTPSYPASLTLRAEPAADPLVSPDPDGLPATRVAPPAGAPGAGSFGTSLPLSLVPGELLRVESAGQRVLLVRPGAGPPP